MWNINLFLCLKYHIFLLNLNMIRDTLLICCIVICCVLFYRMYVLNQKINNLEEKVSVMDNFTQSIFNFITSKDEQTIKDARNTNEAKEIIYSNTNVDSVETKKESRLDTVPEEDTESELNVYNTNTEAGEKISETFESKEILSEMVAELKESLIKTDIDDLSEGLKQVDELKQELKQKLKQELKQELIKNSKSKSDVNLTNVELSNLLSNVDVKVMDTPVVVNNKKKQEDLTKMSLNDLKALAKKKNISSTHNNKPKKKETLIQDILNA